MTETSLIFTPLRTFVITVNHSSTHFLYGVISALRERHFTPFRSYNDFVMRYIMRVSLSPRSALLFPLL